MDAAEHLAGLRAAPGELVAIDLPPGADWLPVLRRLWEERVAFLPLDQRLTSAERRAVVDRARPAGVIDPVGLTLFPGEPIAPGIAAVVATSGTGGEPKLAELPREAFTAALATSTEVLRIDPMEPWVACLSPAHVGGLSVLLRNAILGTPVIVHEGFDPQRLLTQTPGSPHVSLVPTLLRRLTGLVGSPDLSRLGTLLVGGATLDEELSRDAESLGARVVATYGLTETCGGAVYDGRPFPIVRVLVQEPEHRILIAGPMLMEGYRNDPAGTGAAFTTEGWLRTGDAGRLTDDGLLHVDGRVDDAIRTGSETVWPDEVERALATHPSVADVGVAGRQDSEWGHHVAAFVVPADATDPPTLEGLQEHVREALARFKAPRELILVRSIPRTESGKIRRRDLSGA